MKALITNSLISSIKIKDKPYDIWDAKLTGFILRVLPSGTLVYRCEYARGKRITLGRSNIITPAQARDHAKEILAESIRGTLPQTKTKKKSPPTLDEFIKNEYSNWRYTSRKNPKKDINGLLTNFSEEFGKLPLSDISPLALDKWRSKRIAANIKHITVNRNIAILKALLKKAEEWGIISESPLQKYKLTRVENTAKVRYLNADEEKRLMNALTSRDEKLKSSRARFNKWRTERNYPLLPDLMQYHFADHLTPMILVSLNTGLRQGELFGLKWENINFDRAVLTVTADTAKSGKTRHVPINSAILEIFNKWRDQMADSDLVFASKKTGEIFNNVKKAWASLLDSARIEKFRWHDMRHHFASRLVMAGVDLNTVRELLGHSDLKMTLRYAHLAPEHKANAVEKLVQKDTKTESEDFLIKMNDLEKKNPGFCT
jgi:integrase